MSFAGTVASNTIYPESSKELVVLTLTLYVAEAESLLQTATVETTAEIAVQLYSVSAVPIVPVDTSAPSRLYAIAMFLCPH